MTDSEIRPNFYHQYHAPRHLHPTPSDHYITIPNMSSANKFRFNKQCVCRKWPFFFVQTQLCELVTPATTVGDEEEPPVSAPETSFLETGCETSNDVVPTGTLRLRMVTTSDSMACAKILDFRWGSRRKHSQDWPSVQDDGRLWRRCRGGSLYQADRRNCTFMKSIGKLLCRHAKGATQRSLQGSSCGLDQKFHRYRWSVWRTFEPGIGSRFQQLFRQRFGHRNGGADFLKDTTVALVRSTLLWFLVMDFG